MPLSLDHRLSQSGGLISLGCGRRFHRHTIISEARLPGCLEGLAGRGPESPSNDSTKEEGCKGGHEVFAQVASGIDF